MSKAAWFVGGLVAGGIVCWAYTQVVKSQQPKLTKILLVIDNETRRNNLESVTVAIKTAGATPVTAITSPMIKNEDGSWFADVNLSALPTESYIFSLTMAGNELPEFLDFAGPLPNSIGLQLPEMTPYQPNVIKLGWH